jgi:uncharacterized protein YndB with AHSA1/START domain
MTTPTTRTTSTKNTEHSADFAATKTFRSSPEEVLAALQSIEAISGWWGPASGSAAEGDTFRADFGEGRYHEIRVSSVERGRVVWTSASAPHHHGEWEGTTMVFELAPDGAGTEMSFRHTGLTPQLECYGNCSAGWRQVLASLVDYVDTGTGHPYRLDWTE